MAHDGSPVSRDVRPRALLGAIDVLERNYKTTDGLVDCAAVYAEGFIDQQQRPTDDTEVWTFTKRITDVASAPPVLMQVVILDDLIVAEDKRVDVAPGAERRNLVFEYNVQADEVVALLWWSKKFLVPNV